MAKLAKQIKHKKIHIHFALHIPTQACWWFIISVVLNITPLFLPYTEQNLGLSILGSVAIFIASHMTGKKRKWI